MFGWKVTVGFAWCLAAACGCASMTPGKMERVQPQSDASRVGNVYLVRGFIGIWSHGIDQLAERINAAGVRASVFQEDQWRRLAEQIVERYKGVERPEPLVLVGHSYGADDVVRMARRLEEEGIAVDLLVTIDPVVKQEVPKNVKLCYNLYLPSPIEVVFPFLRGVPLVQQEGAVNVRNVNLRENTHLMEAGTDHFNIEKKATLHAEIVRVICEVCPPRATP